MRLYLTTCGHWQGTQADARQINKQFTCEDVPTDKAGLLAWLNENCGPRAEPVQVQPVQVQPVSVPQTEPMTEDTFEALSLPMQLHLACLAMENARTRLKP